jgi:hypothetical protein
VEAGLIFGIRLDQRDGNRAALSLAMYFAAVAPPAPPPITTTRGLACPSTAGAPNIMTPANDADPEINCRRLMLTMLPPILFD